LIEAFNMDLSAHNMRILAVFRMLRLVRLLRLFKVFHFLPELFVLVRGIGIAFRAISLVFALLGLIIYCGAIVLRTFLDGTAFGNLRFQTVPQAMGTLLLDCAMSGTRGGPLIREAYAENMVFSGLIFVFSVLTNVTVMGVLAALLVQTIKKVAEVEEEEKNIMASLEKIESFWKHVASMDETQDGYITMEGFFELLRNEKTVKLLHNMGVDPENLIFLADFVFSENMNRLSREAFNRFVLDLRVSQKSTLKDEIVTRKFMNTRLTQLSQSVADQFDLTQLSQNVADQIDVAMQEKYTVSPAVSCRNANASSLSL